MIIAACHLDVFHLGFSLVICSLPHNNCVINICVCVSALRGRSGWFRFASVNTTVMRMESRKRTPLANSKIVFVQCRSFAIPHTKLTIRIDGTNHCTQMGVVRQIEQALETSLVRRSSQKVFCPIQG